MDLKLYTYPGNKNAFKALIAAQYVGAKIEVPAFNMGTDNKSPEFLKLNPNGKASRPCLIYAPRS
jgi:elongation factor 1-gamma